MRSWRIPGLQSRCRYSINSPNRYPPNRYNHGMGSSESNAPGRAAESPANRDVRRAIELAMAGSPDNVNGANRCSTSVSDSYDVCVIGGGVHGVGVAQAAAAAGYRVILLEKSQLAAGTSSRSSKLIHGGLRYLEQWNIRLVRESLREREILLRIAPELVRRQTFLIPVYDRMTRKPWELKIGLSLYAVLSGGPIRNTWRTIPRSQWDTLDGLEQTGLRQVLQYEDGQTDDAALTRAIMQSAQDLGADLFYPARLEQAEVTGTDVQVSFQFGNAAHVTRAKTMVNAAGPWASLLAGRFRPQLTIPEVENVQGTHIELPGVIGHGCYYVEAEDRRAVFVMPWQGHTLVGTTETLFTGDPDNVKPLAREVQYLLDVYGKHFPRGDQSILNGWAGLRVLPVAEGGAFSRSRETLLPVDNTTQPRVVTILGGKLTGYRATADKVLRILRRTLPPAIPVADTRWLTLADPATLVSAHRAINSASRFVDSGN